MRPEEDGVHRPSRLEPRRRGGAGAAGRGGWGPAVGPFRGLAFSPGVRWKLVEGDEQRRGIICRVPCKRTPGLTQVISYRGEGQKPSAGGGPGPVHQVREDAVFGAG